MVNQTTFPQLAGYTFVETIYQGTCTVVYRAIADATKQSVIIKILAQEIIVIDDLATELPVVDSYW